MGGGWIQELSQSGYRTVARAQNWMEAGSELEGAEPGRQESRLLRMLLGSGLRGQCEKSLCSKSLYLKVRVESEDLSQKATLRPRWGVGPGSPSSLSPGLECRWESLM